MREEKNYTPPLSTYAKKIILMLGITYADYLGFFFKISEFLNETCLQKNCFFGMAQKSDRN
jgi:hypothetical protein